MKKILIMTSLLLAACMMNKPDYIVDQTAFCEEESGKLVCKDAEKNMLSGHLVDYLDKDTDKAKGKIEFDVRNGLLTGLATYYDEEGNKIRESNAKEGKIEGIVKNYDKEGRLIAEILYEDGKNTQTGKAYYYYESGKLMQEEEKKDGKTEGFLKRYYESGKLMVEGEYKAGKPDGIVKSYYENGKLMKEASFKDGKESSTRKIYYYYDSGKLKQQLEDESVNSKKFTGTARDYYENGTLKHEGRYKDGKEEGIHRFYDENGNIEGEEKYKNGEVVDEEKECRKRIRYCDNNEYIKGCRTILSGKVTGVSKDGVTLRAENAFGYYWFLYTNKKYARGDKMDGTKYFEYVGTHEYITTDGALDRLHAYKETNIPVTCGW